MKKVLELIGTRVVYGGIEAFVQSVIQNLDKSRYDVDCVTIFDCNNIDFEESLKKSGISFYAMNLPVNGKIFRNDVYIAVRKFLMEKDYDVIHIHSGGVVNLATLAAAADYSDKVKVIAHSHVSGENFSLPYRIIRRLGAFSMAKHVDCYCACSKEAADWKFIPQKGKPVLIIRNGIDTEKFHFDWRMREKMRCKFGLDEDSFVVGNVGRMVASKNQQFVCSVFLNLLRDMPNARLLFVGDGEERKEIERFVHNAGVDDKVIFAGEVGNVSDHLQAMDVFIFPSLFEGFGIASLEAQAVGLPVISADTLPSEVKATENMCFIPLEAGEKTWAQQIIKYSALTRKDETESIVRKGYDIRYTAEQLCRIYG